MISVSVYAVVGVMATLVMDGGVFPTVTGADVMGVPGVVPSVGVAVQAMAWPASNDVPVMFWVVTDNAPATVHCHV